MFKHNKQLAVVLSMLTIAVLLVAIQQHAKAMSDSEWSSKLNKLGNFLKTVESQPADCNVKQNWSSLTKAIQNLNENGTNVKCNP